MSYQMTINDTSPLVQYTGGWNQCFTVSGCTASAAGASGVGESYHAVNGSGVLQLTFSGDSIQVFGEFGDAAAGTISVDGSALATSYSASSAEGLDTLLASAQNLSSSQHTLQLQPSGPLNFTSAVVSVSSPSFQAVQPTSLPYWDPSITYSGTWTYPTVQGLPNGTARTNELGAQARLGFNGVGVVVYSSLNNGHGPFNVTLDGQTTEYTAAGEQWLVPETIVYYASHLQEGSHELVLSNNGAGGSTTFTLNSITVYQLAGSGPATGGNSTTTAPTTASTTPAPAGNGGNGSTCDRRSGRPGIPHPRCVLLPPTCG
ncbi:hypothetical protein DACRYDRAFT_95721 [Dacryopinax primogenitus]|uniref:Uncharacterized protein n=1 Tax=Dacryopinax primogenitus (strain DJM 731) TaxID=1858805 RepID=M5FRN5_DACPD|nr:uncharacterized protein DACRYDRAFT_95721 [Dacryopinax primogenitus]EJT99850.1 hypothetical protein DACRYDRAFT_95721 [Dacryopinax primogenitus]